MNNLITIQNNLTEEITKKIDALPRGFNTTRFIQNCLSVLKSIQGIENIDINSIKDTIMKGAYLGLDFSNKECYAIAYNKKLPDGTWVKELQFQTDYKGEKKIARKYGIKKIKDLYAYVVREGDILDVHIESGNQIVNFKPVVFSDKEIIGVFAVCLYENGEMIIETMSVSDVNEIKNYYAKKDKNGDFSKAWVQSFGEMCKKTVLRRLCKHIEIDFETIEQKDVYENVSDFQMPKIQSNEINEIELKRPEPIKKIEVYENKDTKLIVNNDNEKEVILTDANYITEPQRKRLFAISKKHNVSDDNVKDILKSYGILSTREIKKTVYDLIISEIEGESKNVR